jgi:hypothetical protein
MPTTRYGHVCALVQNQTTGENEIVAAGGSDDIEHFNIVEIYNIEVDIWRTGTTHKCYNNKFV